MDNPQDLLVKLQHLNRLADQNDEPARAEIRRILNSCPQLWTHLGDVAVHAELALVDLIVGEDSLLKEAVVTKLRGLKAELAGESPSPLERLLCERVAATWLQAAHADLVATQNQGLPAAQLSFLERQRHRANARFLTAARTLAACRKLLYRTPSPIEIASGSRSMPRPLQDRLSSTEARLSGVLN